MLNIKKLLLIPIVAIACLFTRIDSVMAVDYYFTVTTTNQTSSSWNFQFTISAKGTFYVDCGTNGTLSKVNGTATVSGVTITKTGNVNNATFKCQYTSSGSKTIRFGGVATAYSTSAAMISFSGNSTVASISGNLSTIFPYLGAGSGQYPLLKMIFYNCTNLTSIPDTLFSGYTTGYDSMFYYTFGGCTGLTSIPALFKNITTSAQNMFNQTFSGCTGLTSISADLFKNITTGASLMFNQTFSGCTGLTSIPANLFFPNATSVSGASSMFTSTFYGCTGLTSIPAGLFKNITTGAGYMFYYTFGGCTGLTSIPADLFKNITTSGTSMFRQTFEGCTNIVGYIPTSTFAGLIANGSPTTSIMWRYTFTGTQLVTTCPGGTTQYITGYEDYWDGHVSCGTPITCSSGYYLPANSTSCATCPSGETCLGGMFVINAPANQGISKKINLTWYDGSTTISGPNVCTFGGTFVPPTPPARTGYIFSGWRVKAVNP